MKSDFYERISNNPIISAVSSEEQLTKALESPSEIIFILKSDIFNLKSYVDRIREVGKSPFVHIDLIDGLARDTLALKYINENICPDGIITTKTGLVKAAKNMGIFVIQRLFILDHLSFETGLASILAMKPDAVEILPGIMPKITKRFVKSAKIPVITGGLIMDKEDVILSLKAGASAISSGCETVWYL